MNRKNKKLCWLGLFKAIALLNYGLLIAQTSVVQQDTIKKSEPLSSQLKLPDVLIYGEDKTVRHSVHKLLSDKDETEPIILLHAELEQLSATDSAEQKSHYKPQWHQIGSRGVAEVGYGRFQKLDFLAGWWRQIASTHFGIYAKYDRQDGEHRNSQFYNGNIDLYGSGEIATGYRLNGKLQLNSTGFGLYSAYDSSAERSCKNWATFVNFDKALGNAHNYGVGIHIKNIAYEDRYSDNRVQRNEQIYGIDGDYSFKYRKFSANVEWRYYHHTFSNPDNDSKFAQNYLEINPSLNFVASRYLAFNAGFLFEDFEAGENLSKQQLSPLLELVVTPFDNLGFKAGFSRRIEPVIFNKWQQINPFALFEISQTPVKKSSELSLIIEYSPQSKISFSTQLLRQNFEDYGCWLGDQYTRLFRIHRLQQVTITEWRTSLNLLIGRKMLMDIGAVLKFDEVKIDSLSGQDTVLPYFERLVFPINFEYKFSRQTTLLAKLKWIGPRQISIISGDELDSYTDFSFEFRQKLFSKLTAIISGKNILNSDYEYWQGYPAWGATIEAAVRASW